MSACERKNSCISVEFESHDSEAVLLGSAVERLWNRGQYDTALMQLTNLEARVGCVAIGNSWRRPVPTRETGLWGSDVRIGNRDSIAELSLAYEAMSGNLFVVFRHGTGLPHFSVCMSADAGATWVETFTWNGTPPTSLDAAVATGHLYVVYNSPGENAQQLRLRRLACSDGRPDGPWVVPCTLDVGDTMREVSLVSNQNNNRLHIVTLVSDGSVLVSFAYPNVGQWTRLSTGISSGAYCGLDAADDGRSDTACIFFSYYDANDSLRVYGGSEHRLTLHTGRSGSTSISAFCGSVVCAFEDETTLPHQVRYVASLGDTAWSTTTLSDAGTAAEAPVVAVGDHRLAAIFRHCGPTAELRFRWFTDSGFWSDPVSIADHAPSSNRPEIAYLGPGAYGVAYLSDTSPVVRGAFFDRSDWAYGVAEWRRHVVVEATLRVTPNPLKGRGHLSYESNQPVDLRLRMYDRTGRFVRALFEGGCPTGRQALTLDVSDLSPGVYFIRAAVNTRARNVPVTVVR